MMVLLTIIEITETCRIIEIQGDGTMKETGTTEVDVILEAVTTIVVMTGTVTINGGTMILAGRMILMVRGEMMTETGVITDEMIIVGEAIVMPEDHGRIITASQMSPLQWIDRRRQLLVNLVRFNRVLTRKILRGGKMLLLKLRILLPLSAKREQMILRQNI